MAPVPEGDIFSEILVFRFFILFKLFGPIRGLMGMSTVACRLEKIVDKVKGKYVNSH